MTRPNQSDFPKLASPARRALANASITNLKQLTKITETDFKKLHGIGPNALKQIKLAMKNKALSFSNK